MSSQPQEEPIYRYRYHQRSEPTSSPVVGSSYCEHKDSCASGARSAYDLAQINGTLLEFAGGSELNLTPLKSRR